MSIVTDIGSLRSDGAGLVQAGDLVGGEARSRERVVGVGTGDRGRARGGIAVRLAVVDESQGVGEDRLAGTVVEGHEIAARDDVRVVEEVLGRVHRTETR